MPKFTTEQQVSLWPDDSRAAAFARWLAPLCAARGLLAHSVRPASSDASLRRYLRLDAENGSSYIVMDAPPHTVPAADGTAFVRVQALMQSAGLHVPQILAHDAAHGFMLLTDLGPRPLIDLLDAQQPEKARAWYLAAVDVLLRWQRASRPGVLPPYDAALLRRELQLFPDWYVARIRAATLSGGQRNTLAQTFDCIVAHNLAAPAVFVHRDFMMRNLMPPHSPAATLGVLDFQDAVCGPVSYDIASLLCDAFISWEEDFVLDITVRYWEKARAAHLIGSASRSGWGADFADFYRAVQWMALQRHLKVLGVFARLALRDGKPRYVQDAPRFVRYIRSTCARWRELGPLLRLMDHIEGTPAQYAWGWGRG